MRREQFSLSRVETFSDGIFAIIVTLLVFQLKVPHVANVQSVTQLALAVRHEIPAFISWILSFLLVCVIWINHHRLFVMFKTIDHGLFWLNAMLLMWVSLLPFPTALLGDYITNPVALTLFGVVLVLISGSFWLMRLYVLRDHDRLLSDDIRVPSFIHDTRRSLIFGPVLYGAGAALSWVSPPAALLVYALMPVFFILPRTARRPQIAA
jgi:uncharacterized membrane protein